MLIRGHIRHLQRRNLRPSTITQRRERLRHFERAVGPVHAATREQIETYLDQWPQASTRATYLGHLRSFFKWAVAEGLLPSDPTVGIPSPRVPSRAPRPISEAELRTVLEAADDRMRLWIMLAAYCGLRSCEIAVIHGEDVMPGPPAYLRVRGQKGGDEGTVALPSSVLAELGRWPSSGPLWGKELGRGYVAHLAAEHFHACGIAGGLHRGRHRFGTRFLQASGFDLRTTAEAMRHRSPATTMIYTAVARDRMSAIAEAIA